MKNIAVIGAGPSGIMASIKASSNANVMLFEKKSSIGKKLAITGGGRCNITSAVDIDSFNKYIPRGSKFLLSSFSKFNNMDLLRFFNSYNLKFKREEDKYYPVTDSSKDVIDALYRALKKSNVDLHLKERLLDISLEDYSSTEKKDKHTKKVHEIKTNLGTYKVDSLIICCGGLSYPATGSDGDIFPILNKIGVNTTKFYPSLVQIHTKEETSSVMGVSLDEVKVFAKVGKKAFETNQSLMFTAKGLSGPAIMNITSFLTEFDPVDIDFRIDFLPKISVDKLESLLFSVDKKVFSNILGGKYLPVRLAKYLLSPFDSLDKFNLTKKEKQMIIDSIKASKFNIKSFGSIKESVVTRGGVNLKEVLSSTMEHKYIKGLFFAGECLDLDALTGGYNLQIAFSTGNLAGLNA